MPNCTKIREHLTAYLDGQIDPYVKGIIEEHLSKCGACRKELDALSKTWKLLDYYPQLSVSASYKENFYNRLNKSKQPIQLKRWLYPVAAAAAVLLAVTLTLVFTNEPLQPAGPSSTPTPEITTPAEIAIAENITAEEAEVVVSMTVLEELSEFGENDLADLMEFLDSQQETEILQDLLDITNEPF